MIILIAGSTHTGKTLLAQKLLEQYGYPYLSIDHLKMGLIRSGQTALTVFDDEQLTGYLWPVVKEIIKTAIENKQNLIVEGCYIPFNRKNDFGCGYLEHIQYSCLIMTQKYIENNFCNIKKYANVIENRIDDSCLEPEKLIKENARNRQLCEKYGCDYVLIDGEYAVDIKL